MKALWFHNFYRILAALAILAIFVAAAPYSAQAASNGVFNIIAVKQDESVTIRTYNFPASQLLNVRMDVVGNAAVGGIIVTQTNTGAGGSFEETYRIPAELRGKLQLAIRFENDSGFYAYNWFNNQTAGSTSTGNNGSTGGTTTPVPVTGRGPNIKFVSVISDQSVTIDANNFPASTYFNVRVGPFYNFWKGSEVVATLNSGEGGNFRFTVNIPRSARGSTWVSVRLDSTGGGYFAYNAFKNIDLNTADTDTGDTIATGGCQITSYAPSASILKNAEFDGKWTVKNTSARNWDSASVDYKYIGGTDMNKHGSIYDLPKTIKPGESITIIVDMIAPQYSGWYSTSWAIVQGSGIICNLPLTLYISN
jgi:hypothetical protein